MNAKVDTIIKENQFVSRPSLVENVEHIGRKLRKAEKKSAILDHILTLVFELFSCID